MTLTADRVISLPRPHPAQQEVIRSQRRYNALCCGRRRWGKSTLGIDRAISPAMEGYPVAWFSPTYRMLTEIWREARIAFAPATLRVSAQEHRIELVTGGVFEMWSLDTPNTARGRRYALAVVDEAAMVADLEHAWNAVIRPTLVDFKGGAWFLSTPKGHGYFKTLYDLGQDPAQEDWASWQMPTLSNPHIDPQEVEAARLMLPERTFAQEFLAMFLEDGGGVFRRVTEAATATRQERAAKGHRYVVGVDLARRVDFTVLTVLDTTTREVVALDRFNQVEWAFQVQRLKALSERFAPDQITVDQTGLGDPVVEQIRRELPTVRVTGYQFTNPSKALLVEGLAMAFERGEVRIPDDPVLLAELHAFDAERLPGGAFRYGAPSGQHDDHVLSLALAWQTMTAPRVNVRLI